MKNDKVFENKYIFVEVEDSEIPWVKIFTQKPYKEFSECDIKTKEEILKALDVIEKAMLNYYKPKKINIASFGNYLPLVHFHVMARFEEDSYFPEPMWGEKQRESNLKLPSLDKFLSLLVHDFMS